MSAVARVLLSRPGRAPGPTRRRPRSPMRTKTWIVEVGLASAHPPMYSQDGPHRTAAFSSKRTDDLQVPGRGDLGDHRPGGEQCDGQHRLARPSRRCPPTSAWQKTGSSRRRSRRSGATLPAPYARARSARPRGSGCNIGLSGLAIEIDLNSSRANGKAGSGDRRCRPAPLRASTFRRMMSTRPPRCGPGAAERLAAPASTTCGPPATPMPRTTRPPSRGGRGRRSRAAIDVGARPDILQ